MITASFSEQGGFPPEEGSKGWVFSGPGSFSVAKNLVEFTLWLLWLCFN